MFTSLEAVPHSISLTCVYTTFRVINLNWSSELQLDLVMGFSASGKYYDYLSNLVAINLNESMTFNCIFVCPTYLVIEMHRSLLIGNNYSMPGIVVTKFFIIKCASNSLTLCTLQLLLVNYCSINCMNCVQFCEIYPSKDNDRELSYH